MSNRYMTYCRSCLFLCIVLVFCIPVFGLWSQVMRDRADPEPEPRFYGFGPRDPYFVAEKEEWLRSGSLVSW